MRSWPLCSGLPALCALCALCLSVCGVYVALRCGAVCVVRCVCGAQYGAIAGP
ncbi:hypothetical protein SEA_WAMBURGRXPRESS_136 [Mycobacterium phage Wamburgrxpress]|uniref:Uncharacterized protein n=1 Tax=Mycobacterium phage Wamburgrxpress TaxID=2315617 RepID=A0A386KA90_9CAUD|nr:hypothetical protein SEA_WAMBURGRXPRESS_136 [Mycobacterium phage Wamburgrxpress]